MKFNLILFLSVVSCMTYIACSTAQREAADKEDQKLIAISWYYPNNSYQSWLHSHDPTLKFVNIYDTSDDSIQHYLSQASGFLMTGGCDIHPGLFGAADQVSRCGALDPRRDSLEKLMVESSFKQKVPLLGVCRGMQMMNIVAGGDLIIDLPADKQTHIHQVEEGDAYHTLLVVGHTMLNSDSATAVYEVNSNHHQGIGKPARGYKPVAIAPDGVIEAFAWTDTSTHPFALGVHWHPERLDPENAMSHDVAGYFLEATESYFAARKK